MKLRIMAMAALALAISSGAWRAADPRYPDWPCTQAKVPEVSLAAVWARRHQGQMEGQCEGQCAGVPTFGAEDAAG
jgi:hypothetical protein